MWEPCFRERSRLICISFLPRRSGVPQLTWINSSMKADRAFDDTMRHGLMFEAWRFHNEGTEFKGNMFTLNH
jgi:hypothetical protein